MAEGISLSELARRLDRDKAGLWRKADKGQIPKLPDGSYDEDAVREALKGNIDPARAKPLMPVVDDNVSPPPVVSTLEDAEAAVALIRQVLRQEGRELEGAPTFDDVRTAETILKTRERAINIAAQERDVTPTKAVLKHVEEAFSNYKRELLSLPARYGADLAAACGGDLQELDRALSKVIREHLEGLSAPVVRT